MTTAGEPELVDRAREGDEAAFETLLRAVLPAGYRLACAMLQDRQLAEDAVQEAAVNAWRKLHQLRAGSTMTPWFLGIVANQCRALHRARWWSVRKAGSWRESVAVQDGMLEARADLRRALARLKPELRLVVILYYYLDLSLEDIATIAGASFAAVRGRLYRAIKQLKPDLQVVEAEP
jgi:RNA polymerase sigma-70 factor (ECF subfamily)